MTEKQTGFRKGMTRMEYEALTSIPENLVRGLVGLLASFLGIDPLSRNRRREQRAYQEPSETYQH